MNAASFTADTKSFISFNADFGVGQASSLNAATINGTTMKLKTINSEGSIVVGNSVQIFDAATITISNLGSFKLIDSGTTYTFTQTNGDKNITVATAEVLTYPIYVAIGKTLDFKNTNVLNKTSGVINNDDTLTVTGSDFAGNKKASGNGGVITTGSGSTTEIINANMTNNASSGLGGAIYSVGDVRIGADGKDIAMTDNTDNTGANDVYMQGATLYLGAHNGGTLSFNDGINGYDYAMVIGGDNNSSVNLNAADKNVTNLQISGATLNLVDESYINGASTNILMGTMNIANGTIGTMNISDLTGSSGAITIDVDPIKAVSDVLNISGELTGVVKVNINALNTAMPSNGILFAVTPNDTDLTDGMFKVDKVTGSLFKWKASYDADADIAGWYLGGYIADNGSKEVVFEVIPYLGLQAAGIEQTRSMVNSIRAKVGASKICYNNCGVYDELYNNEPLYNTWVSPVYYTSTIKKPTHIKSDIWGVEAGFDVQSDAHNKLGVFAFYRRGDYDLNGYNKDYFSTVKSEIDIDSYIGGLYYRHDSNNARVFAAVYGGIQKADLKTRDGSKDKTDGTQFGGSIELGYVYEIEPNLTVELSIGASYTQIGWDKTVSVNQIEAKYDTIHHSEIEVGVNLEKAFRLDEGVAKIYVKPSVIQTITDGDSVMITGLNKADTYHDRLLGRLELGGKYAITDQLSAYGFVSYTGGGNYQTTSVGAGLGYSW